MRLLVGLCMLLGSVQFVFAQEAPPVITVENVHRLRPLSTIALEDAENPIVDIIFSEFVTAAPNLFLLSESGSAEGYRTVFYVWDLETERVIDTITFPSNGPVYQTWQFPARSIFLVWGIGPDGRYLVIGRDPGVIYTVE